MTGRGPEARCLGGGAGARPLPAGAPLSIPRAEAALTARLCPQGDYDQGRTKVLHMTVNPASEAQQSLRQDQARLREECEQLRQLLGALGRGGPAPAGLQASGLPPSQEVAGRAPRCPRGRVSPVRPESRGRHVSCAWDVHWAGAEESKSVSTKEGTLGAVCPGSPCTCAHGEAGGGGGGLSETHGAPCVSMSLQCPRAQGIRAALRDRPATASSQAARSPEWTVPGTPHQRREGTGAGFQSRGKGPAARPGRGPPRASATPSACELGGQLRAPGPAGGVAAGDSA